jgi:hypothetical protein
VEFSKILKLNVQMAKWIRDIISTGTLGSRDITYKNRKHPGMFQTGDIKCKGLSGQIKDIIRDVVNKGHNE